MTETNGLFLLMQIESLNLSICIRSFPGKKKLVKATYVQKSGKDCENVVRTRVIAQKMKFFLFASFREQSQCTWVTSNCMRTCTYSVLKSPYSWILAMNSAHLGINLMKNSGLGHQYS